MIPVRIVVRVRLASDTLDERVKTVDGGVHTLDRRCSALVDTGLLSHLFSAKFVQSTESQEGRFVPEIQECL